MARSGLVVVDKPAGLTSHDVVARLRRVFGTRRVGHGGTLDPMATGVLVVGVEGGTKALQFVADATKSYSATVRLGEQTNTDDAEGELVCAIDASRLTDSEIARAFAAQVGEVRQVPPAFSAIKVDGVRSYHRARQGADFELAARPVRIAAIDILDSRRSGRVVDVDIRVVCGKGTYIRAIARDAGARLGVGGHLTALRRTENAGFTIADAVPLEEAERGFVPLAAALTRFLPAITVDAAEAQSVRHGRQLPWRWEGQPTACAVLDPAGGLLAIGECAAGRLGYHAVLAGPLED